MKGLVLHTPFISRRKLPFLALVDSLPSCDGLTKKSITSSLRCRVNSRFGYGTVRVQASNVSIGSGGYEERKEKESEQIFSNDSTRRNTSSEISKIFMEMVVNHDDEKKEVEEVEELMEKETITMPLTKKMLKKIGSTKKMVVSHDDEKKEVEEVEELMEKETVTMPLTKKMLKKVGSTKKMVSHDDEKKEVEEVEELMEKKTTTMPLKKMLKKVGSTKKVGKVKLPLPHVCLIGMEWNEI